MTSNKPDYIEDVRSSQRHFPPSWRDAAIRELTDPLTGRVGCAQCPHVASRPAEKRRLHCDHIIPYSKGGETTWANLQLLCARCNLSKNAKV